MIALLDQERMLAAEIEEIQQALRAARGAQGEWAARSVKDRAALIGKVRPLLAARVTEIAQVTAAVNGRPVAEKIVSEVLPLLAACKFLERNAARVLRSRRFGAVGRPLWLHGSSFEVFRKPFGVILIVGPGNYPLFLPAVHALHALVAGNAVVIKPAEGASAPLTEFLLLLARAGISSNLVQLLPETPQAARVAAQLGVDKAIFTGSLENGRDFLAHLAAQNTPCVMELSGADTVYVRADADVELAAKAIRFGLQLNDGNTCMAPHAIVVHEAAAKGLTEALARRGAAPDISLFRVRSDGEALEIAAMDEHGLGAAVFSRDENAAREFARQLATGFVTINDIIVPTADPRMPFGGVRGSGFGTTRGTEGLLEMTHPQAIAVRRSRFRPHLEAPTANDASLFAAFAGFLHGSGATSRWRSLRDLLVAARARKSSLSKTSP